MGGTCCNDPNNPNNPNNSVIYTRVPSVDIYNKGTHMSLIHYSRQEYQHASLLTFAAQQCQTLFSDPSLLVINIPWLEAMLETTYILHPANNPDNNPDNPNNPNNPNNPANGCTPLSSQALNKNNNSLLTFSDPTRDIFSDPSPPGDDSNIENEANHVRDVIIPHESNPDNPDNSDHTDNPDNPVELSFSRFFHLLRSSTMAVQEREQVTPFTNP